MPLDPALPPDVPLPPAAPVAFGAPSIEKLSQGRLGRYRAGRGNPNEWTPEKEAELYLDRKRRAGQNGV